MKHKNAFQHLHNIGIIGLGVMGANLARNLASKKWRTVVYNRSHEQTQAFLKKYGNECLCGEAEIKKFVLSLEKPRKIIIIVTAGQAVDSVIANVLPYLDKGDILADFGNSF